MMMSSFDFFFLFNMNKHYSSQHYWCDVNLSNHIINDYDYYDDN